MKQFFQERIQHIGQLIDIRNKNTVLSVHILNGFHLGFFYRSIGQKNIYDFYPFFSRFDDSLARIDDAVLFVSECCRLSV